MQSIIDYPVVLHRLTGEGLQCNYPGGGSFGFACQAQIQGWIGPADPTIKPAMQDALRNIPQPYVQNLASVATRAWQRCLSGNLWLMPAAHWAFELSENGKWLADALEDLQLPVGRLRGLSQAAAIEFSDAETHQCRHLLQQLLQNLAQSDFVLAFPGRPMVCTVHHHKQLWWVTPDIGLLAALDGVLRELNY